MSFFDRFRKKAVTPAPAKPARGIRICFVLCKAAAHGDLSNASSVVSEVLGAGYSAEYEGKNFVSVTHRGKEIGLLAHMPAPIPNGEAEEYADRNFLWPDGRTEVAGHRSHVVVTTLNMETISPVQSAMIVSRLALVALRLFDGIGVYWGGASVCNSRSVFESFCEDMTEEDLPVILWLRYQVVRATDDSIGVYTLGMQQFGLMDIEVDRCTMNVRDLFEFVSNYALYLIQSGPVISDGDTVGGNDGERVLVRHRPSMIEKTKTVYKILFDS